MYISPLRVNENKMREEKFVGQLHLSEGGIVGNILRKTRNLTVIKNKMRETFVRQRQEIRL